MSITPRPTTPLAHRPSVPPVRRHAASAVVGALALVLAACGPEDGASTQADAGTKAATTARAAAPAPAPVPKGQLGTVTAVTPVRAEGTSSGAGAVIGGVLGAAVGNQIGKGNGRKAATVLGAVGGAAAGNKIEKDRNTVVTGYRVDIRLDSGGSTAITVASPPGLSAGQRVRVLDGDIVPA